MDKEMSHIHPILAAALAPYAPAIHTRQVNVPVDYFDVDYLRPGYTGNDPEGWVTLKPTDAEMVVAVRELIERHAKELDDILVELITEKAEG
jgi:hypothetical protein